jgi:hypothetical protein
VPGLSILKEKDSIAKFAIIPALFILCHLPAAVEHAQGLPPRPMSTQVIEGECEQETMENEERLECLLGYLEDRDPNDVIL